MLHVSRRLIVAFLLMGMSTLLAPTSARADEGPDLETRSPKVLNIVVLGDSYSAGNGAGKYEHNSREANGEEGAEKAYISRNNWGYRYREAYSRATPRPEKPLARQCLRTAMNKPQRMAFG